MTTGTNSDPAPPGDQRHLPWFAIECGLLVALTVADWYALVPLSRTPFLLLLGWISLRVRKLRWRDVGFSWPPHAGRAVLIGIVVGVAMELLAIGVTTPLITAATGVPLDMSDFQSAVGNFKLLLILLAASWILAAFGEELAFRGYLLNRVADFCGRTRGGWVLSLLLVSAFFGIGHANQGLTGLLQESLSGFLLGVLYLACGRNLTAPIIAHGVANTLAFILIYLNRYAGLA